MKNIYKFVLVTAILISSICLFAQGNIYIPNSNVIMYNISVVGAVNNPGVFTVPPSTRVSSVIKFSEVEYLDVLKYQKTVEIPEEDLQLLQKKYEKYYPEESDENEQIINGSLRNIIVKRGEEKIEVDLLRFFLLGDDENNPYVIDGDIIFVPSRHGSVNISGAVNNEGDIELTKSDRISDIIDLALGTKPDAWLDEVEIVRFLDNKQIKKIIVNFNKITVDFDCDDNISLQLDDRIFIRTKPAFHKKFNVTVAGEVQFPGVYALEEGKTTLLDIMQLCGGLTAKADLYNSFVQRQEGIKELDPEFERLKLMTVANMSKLEYAYFKNAVRELKGKYSLDIPALLSGDKSSNNLTLHDGDFIIVPQKNSFINVTGQVIAPGLIAFETGKSFDYYIEQAGGYDWNARKSNVRLIRANTGKWIKPKSDTIVMEGDIIFIPEKSEFDTWQFTLDSLKIISSIAAIFYTLTLVNLF
ncbi:MAG: SLBB domain-containing protein [FCB group bacterium]|nr:SLBB domain-containing protein [FCB group bacterium]